ncbi:unnamed protein product [Sphacelaria rigidula]
MSCVGSARDIVVRLANAERPPRHRRRGHSAMVDSDDDEEDNERDMLHTGPQSRFEILSLAGTICPDGAHLHASLGDHNGAVLGGHLVRATIHTTAEIVIGEALALSFSRRMDDDTGYKELVVVDGGGRGDTVGHHRG